MSPTAVNRAPTAVEAGKRFNNWAVSLKPQSIVFAGSLLGKAIIMQCYPKSAIFFLVLCPMHNQFKKSSLNTHTLFHMTFSSVFSKVYCLFSWTQYLSAFIYIFKGKPPSNYHRKCPSIGMLSAERLFFSECHPGLTNILLKWRYKSLHSHCILKQPDTYCSGLRAIFTLYYVKVMVKYNRKPNSNGLLSCTVPFFFQ